jgi:PhnB protein
MASVSTYLNFPRTCAAAFEFYKGVFGTDYVDQISYYGGLPTGPGQPPMSEADAKLIMNIQLPILGGHVLMGSDAVEGFGETFTPGNNVSLTLHPDTRADTDRLFAALGAGGTVHMPLADAFWGGYFGYLIDKFGTRWMFNCYS